MTHLASFEILGVPAPQGSKTAYNRGNRAVVVEGGSTTGRAKHAAWRQAVASTARDVSDAEPHDGPLRLKIDFRMPMPASRPAAARNSKRWPHSVKPDIDKLVRSTLDGLTDGGLIRDDARVCALEIEAWEVIGWLGAVVTLESVDASEITVNDSRDAA